MNDSQQRILRAYAQLQAMQKSFADGRDAYLERDVKDYHAALDHIAAAGFDVDEFRIPADEVRPHVSSYNYISKETRVTQAKFVDGSLLRRKIDAVLGYFALQNSVSSQEEPKHIGFRGPQQSQS